jgi:PAS domain-containing protein
MASHDIEIILNRQLADCLSIPVFITDTEGNLIYYNEPAEQILGKRYEESGEMPVTVWGTIFKPEDENRNPLSPEELPLMKTIRNQKPSHKTFFIKSLTGKIERISVTSYPILGRPSRFLGAVALFWDTNNE